MSTDFRPLQTHYIRLDHWFLGKVLVFKLNQTNLKFPSVLLKGPMHLNILLGLRKETPTDQVKV